MSDPYRKRCFQIPRREIAYLRFLVEGYDGLLFLRTLDAAVELVEVAWPASREAEAALLLTALAEETGMLPAPSPEGEVWP